MSELPARYEVRSVLGEGMGGTVYLARDRKLDRMVAVKVLAKDAPETAHRRLRSEAEAMVRWPHPALLPLLDHSLEAARPFLVVPIMAGGDAARFLDGRDPMPATAWLELARRVSAALAHLHDHGVLHRDVKPANVFLDEGGQAYLGDLGLAREEASPQRLTTTGFVAGSARYLAPELLRGVEASCASDVYALALTLVELISGHRAWAPGVADPFPPEVLTALRPPSLRALLCGGLRPDPDARPTAAELYEHLEALEAEDLTPGDPDASSGAGDDLTRSFDVDAAGLSPPAAAAVESSAPGPGGPEVAEPAPESAGPPAGAGEADARGGPAPVLLAGVVVIATLAASSLLPGPGSEVDPTRTPDVMAAPAGDPLVTDAVSPVARLGAPGQLVLEVRRRLEVAWARDPARRVRLEPGAQPLRLPPGSLETLRLEWTEAGGPGARVWHADELVEDLLGPFAAIPAGELAEAVSVEPRGLVASRLAARWPRLVAHAEDLGSPGRLPPAASRTWFDGLALAQGLLPSLEGEGAGAGEAPAPGILARGLPGWARGSEGIPAVQEVEVSTEGHAALTWPGATVSQPAWVCLHLDSEGLKDGARVSLVPEGPTATRMVFRDPGGAAPGEGPEPGWALSLPASLAPGAASRVRVELSPPPPQPGTLRWTWYWSR